MDIADFNSYLAKMHQGARRMAISSPVHAGTDDGIPLPRFNVPLGHLAQWTCLRLMEA
jgi:hypothetical protein